MTSTEGQAAASFHHSDNAQVYTSNAAFVYSDENTRDILALLDAQPGDVILDVGCGTGVLTAKLSALVAGVSSHDGGRAPGRVVGIDVSKDMVSSAQKAQGSSTAPSSPTALSYHECDAHDLEAWLQENNLTGTFDKVFSNATLHWAKRDPAKVARGMAAALKPGGKLAVEFGGHMNCIGVRSTLHSALARRGLAPGSVDPWYFPTPKQYSDLLQTSAGLVVNVASLVPRPTPLPRAKGLVGWLETFAGPFLNALASPAEQAAVLTEVQDALRCDMYDDAQEEWTAMYVRLRIQAHKPARR